MIDLKQALSERHSVRQYLDKPIDGEALEILREEVDKCNQESGLDIQLIVDEPQAFDCMLAHYGKFSGVRNYFAMIGAKQEDFDEKIGYYGQRLVLKAQQLGLNTCWVAASYKKVPEAYRISKGEKVAMVIALGYGATQGKQHNSKSVEDVSNLDAGSPEWFRLGVEGALKAPTAINQQKFTLTLDGEKVRAKAGIGFYATTDLGIVKYNFEIASGKDGSVWA